MITIDYEKCSKCRLCVKDCISGVIQQKNDRPVVCHPDWCNRCGHCLAVCPNRAVIHEKLAKGTPPPRIQKKLLQPKAYNEIVRSRRSIRHYKPGPLSQEILEKVLDLARFSPTASNAQNVQYTVITQKKLMNDASKRIFEFGERIYRIYTRGSIQGLNKLLKDQVTVKSLARYAQNWDYYQKQVAEGRDLLFHHAPALILIHAPRGQGFGRDNCLIAGLNIANYAHTLGLGSCFIGILVMAMQIDRSFNKKFKIPKTHRVYAALTIGYPAIQYTHHTVRKPFKVQWL